jgi:hypothetical protein
MPSKSLKSEDKTLTSFYEDAPGIIRVLPEGAGDGRKDHSRPVVSVPSRVIRPVDVRRRFWGLRVGDDRFVATEEFRAFVRDLPAVVRGERPDARMRLAQAVLGPADGRVIDDDVVVSEWVPGVKPHFGCDEEEDRETEGGHP